MLGKCLQEVVGTVCLSLHSLEKARAQFETNFFGPIRVIKTVLPSMRPRKAGTIINVSSSVGLNAAPSIGHYASSKFALEGAVLSLFRRFLIREEQSRAWMLRHHRTH